MSFIVEIVVGVLLVLPFVPLFNRLSDQWRDRYLAINLVIAGLIYVGFALIWGNDRWLMIELLGLLACVVFAVLGVRFAALFIALGWFLHPVWDVGLHTLVEHEHVPGWYPGLCIGVDWAVAAYAFSKLRRAPTQILENSADTTSDSLGTQS